MDRYIVESCEACKGIGLKKAKKNLCPKCIPLTFTCFTCSRRQRNGLFEECAECCGVGVIFKNRTTGVKTIAPLYNSFIDNKKL